MTWAEHHERMTLMADLIAQAAENHEAATDFNASMPDVAARRSVQVRRGQHDERRIVELHGGVLRRQTVA